MVIIPPPAAPAEPAATAASIDTVEVFALWLPRGFRRQVEEITGERLMIIPRRRGLIVPINRPPLEVLPILDNLIKDRRHGACSSRVDVAYDFLMESVAAADQLTCWIDHYVILKWRSRLTRKWEDEGTIYWCDRHKGRNIALYRKPGNVVRLELRFFRAQTVKTHGLSDVTKLPSVDPKVLFEHHVGGRQLSEKWKAGIIRRAVSEDARRHLKNPTSGKHADRYRSEIAKRINDTLDRAYYVYELHRQWPRERVDLGFLGIPDQLTLP